VADVPADQIQDHELSSARNLLIVDGIVSQRGGYQTVVGSSFSSPVISLYEFVPYNQSAMIVAGTTSSFFYTTGGSWTNITTTARTGTVNNPVFFIPMRTASSGGAIHLISVNGVDPPAIWTGSTASAFVYMTTEVIGACGTVWASHFLQGDVTTSADGRVASRIQWSALGDPKTWSGTASTGILDLLDDNATRIMTFEPMRQTLIAYKEEGAHMIIYKAAPFYFVQRLLHSGITLLSRKGVVSIFNGNQHLVITKEGVVIWDSQNVKYVGANKVDKLMFDELDWDARETVWTAYDPIDAKVLIGWPTASTGPTKMWVYDLRFDSWWEEDLSFFSALYAPNTFAPPKLIGGHSDSKVYEIFSGIGDTTAGNAVVSSLQTKLYSFGIEAHKGIARIGVVAGPGTAGQSTITVSKAGTENPVSQLVFDSGNTLTVTGGTGYPVVDSRITNRYISFRIVHSAASETLQIHHLVPWVHVRDISRKSR
jgi:hypothetical protein